MKRMRIIMSFLFLSLLPFSIVSGQDRKNEEKVKIVVADKSGKEVVLDTTFSDIDKPDSLKLKDGTVVYFGNHPDNELLTGRKRISIKSPDDKNARKISREVTVVSSDSDESQDLNEEMGDNIVVFSHSGEKNDVHGGKYKVITKVGKDGSKSDTRYIYINDDNEANLNNNENFDISVSDNEFDHNTDNTKHVIAKNGVVVTIEGSNEEQINELAKEIEKKLDIAVDKSPSKEPESKSVKKK